ncbi:hypothetical protein DFH09DRAFT_1330672 [Mycena vulgaris]|nr:hypothetical protein DFH09DRAFT_1330672 [Mycena vulgaris]
MNIFLGVLQSNILQHDVGIGNVEPRKLAAGAEDETIYVAPVLCWGETDDARNGSPRLSTLKTAPVRVGSSPLSAAGMRPEYSDKRVSAAASASSSSSSRRPGPAYPARARWSHQVPSPSLLLSPVSVSTLGDLSELLDSGLFTRGLSEARMSRHNSNSTVPYDGYISVVDEEREMHAFEARQARRSDKANGRQTVDASADVYEVCHSLPFPSLSEAR